MTNLNRVCLTPVRNECWIIKEFLAAARMWADRVIVMDQVSTDGTRELLQGDPSVDLICNVNATYDESSRQRTLIERARGTVPDKRILLALDADEFLSANCLESEEWQRIAEAPPGTVLRFRWVNVLPGFQRAWIPEERIACGFVDDGSPHLAQQIHSRRVPWPEGAPVIDLDEVVILHLQYVSEERMLSKHRWYQAWEHMNAPEKSALNIFRQYHHRLGSWKNEEMQLVKPEWMVGFERIGLDLRAVRGESIPWWDKELVEMIMEHGAAYFRKFAIWDVDWDAVARDTGRLGGNYADPRSWWEKLAHRWLAASQGHREKWLVRGFEKILRMAGW